MEALLDMDDCYSILLSPSEGLSGGLVILWNKMLLAVGSNWTSRYCMGAELIHKRPDGDEVFYIINIYNNHRLERKLVVWEEISRILDSKRGKCYGIMGDFNCITLEQDKINCSYRGKDMECFLHFIDANELMEVPLSGLSFTWFGLKVSAVGWIEH